MYSIKELKEITEYLETHIYPLICEMNKQRATQVEIAFALNTKGLLQLNGRPWSQFEVSRFMKANGVTSKWFKSLLPQSPE